MKNLFSFKPFSFELSFFKHFVFLGGLIFFANPHCFRFLIFSFFGGFFLRGFFFEPFVLNLCF